MACFARSPRARFRVHKRSLSKEDFLLGMQSQNRLPEDVYFNALPMLLSFGSFGKTSAPLQAEKSAAFLVKPL